MSNPFVPLRDGACSGFLKEIWVCNSTPPFPAYSGYACSMKVPGEKNPVIVMGAAEADVLTACKHIDPSKELAPEFIRPVVLTHMNNVKLVDDEL